MKSYVPLCSVAYSVGKFSGVVQRILDWALGDCIITIVQNNS